MILPKLPSYAPRINSVVQAVANDTRGARPITTANPARKPNARSAHTAPVGNGPLLNDRIVGGVQSDGSIPSVLVKGWAANRHMNTNARPRRICGPRSPGSVQNLTNGRVEGLTVRRTAVPRHSIPERRETRGGAGSVVALPRWPERPDGRLRRRWRSTRSRIAPVRLIPVGCRPTA